MSDSGGSAIGPLDVSWELRQVVGYPRNEFPRISEATDADAIVLGVSRKRWGFSGMGLARTLMKSRRCPVIVVP